MKKIVLVNLLVFAILQSQAQISNESPNDFFKSSQNRFVESLTQSENKLNEQANKIAALIRLNNELKASGDMTPEKFQKFDSVIIIEKNANETLIAKAKDLKKSLSTLSKTKRSFSKFLKEVPAFTEQIAKENYDKQIGLVKIEKELRGSSLIIEKKVLKVILADASKLQVAEIKNIDNLKDIKETVAKNGSLDSVTLAGVDDRLQVYIRRIEDNAKEIKELEANIANPIEYSTNIVSIKARVLIIDSLVNKTAESRAYTYKMLEESMKKSTKTLFSLAAFFGPGGYSIPEEKMDKARTYFSPLVDSLIKFSNKYAQLQRTATVLVNGYADASQITKGSPLYMELAKVLKNEEPSKEQLNVALSTLRAEKLSDLFTRLIKEKSTSFVALPKIVFENIEVGRGEQLPDATIKYKDNDERRRIVVVYWSVLPNS
jgi:protein-tyrosine-phosphatase